MGQFELTTAKEQRSAAGEVRFAEVPPPERFMTSIIALAQPRSTTKEQVAAITLQRCLVSSVQIAAHYVLLFECDDIDRLDLLREWKDMERIPRTIELAEEAGLTGDPRDTIRPVEDIGRANIHADVAGRAALGIDDSPALNEVYRLRGVGSARVSSRQRPSR